MTWQVYAAFGTGIIAGFFLKYIIDTVVSKTLKWIFK